MEFPVEGYDVDTPELLRALTRWGSGKILLKLPAALQRRAPEIVQFIERLTGREVILSSRPSFGACDISPGECASEGICGVLDLGHAPMPSLHRRGGCHFLSVPLRMEVDEERFVASLEEIPLEPPASLGLLTTAQHRELLTCAADKLRRMGFETKIKKGSERLFFPGQVLGCDLSAARILWESVDAFIYIGTGLFHPRGVALSTGRRVLTLNPLNGQWGEVHADERFFRKRYGVMMRARELMEEGEPVGIYLSSLLGQRRVEVALRLKKELEERGYRTLVLQSEVLSPSQARDLSLKIMVNTACPRITVDDFPLFMEVGTLLLTPQEMEEILMGSPPGEYVLDEFHQ